MNWFYLAVGIAVFHGLVLAVGRVVRDFRAFRREKQLDWAQKLDVTQKECGEAALLHQLRRKRDEFFLTEAEQSVLNTLESVFGP